MNIEAHFQALLQQEDTDGDKRITIHDKGPKAYNLDGLEVKGTYALSNLLQELALAKEQGRTEIDPQLLTQPPTHRISAAIKNRCWDGLTRKIDSLEMLHDPKMPGPPPPLRPRKRPAGPGLL